MVESVSIAALWRDPLRVSAALARQEHELIPVHGALGERVGYVGGKAVARLFLGMIRSIGVKEESIVVMIKDMPSNILLTGPFADYGQAVICSNGSGTTVSDNAALLVLVDDGMKEWHDNFHKGILETARLTGLLPNKDPSAGG